MCIVPGGGVVRHVILLSFLGMPVNGRYRRTAFVSPTHRTMRQQQHGVRARINHRPKRAIELFETASTHDNEIVPQSHSHQHLATSSFRTLYPPSRAFRNGTIQVDSSHTLYYEEHGQHWALQDDEDSSTNNKTTTESATSNRMNVRHALFLHGGPGAGCSPRHAQFFDPSRYHIVLLDQRGAGRSQPRGETRNNTLQHMVDDCETLRRHLNISQWHLILGGSWGSTLALAYAQQYPHVIRSMVLRGVCLLRPCEVNWLFGNNGGASLRLPQAWKDFGQAVGVTSIPTTPSTTNTNNKKNDNDGDENDVSHVVTIQDPRETLHAYYDRLLGDNAVERWKAARSWMIWEQTVASTSPLAHSHPQKENETVQNIDNHKTNENHGNKLPLVLVSSSAGNGDAPKWSYQDLSGQILSHHSLLQEKLEPADHAIQELRQGFSCRLDGDGAASVALLSPRIIRPVNKSSDARNGLSAQQQQQLEEGLYLPVQSMLTCYFSVNERYVLNNTPLLHSERMARLLNEHLEMEHAIKVIAIHGGQDSICPLDNALELLQAWPNLELRVPLQAGHSMYDPPVTHEIIQATDRLASGELH